MGREAAVSRLILRACARHGGTASGVPLAAAASEPRPGGALKSVRMGLYRWLRICCAVMLLVMSVPSAGAQPSLQPVSDPKGLFSIGLPSDWQIAGHDLSDLVFQRLRSGPMAGNVISTLAAHNLGDIHSLASLAVVAMDLPQPVSSSAFGGIARSSFPSNWTMTQDGRATIAGRDAYYVYFVMNERETGLYMVMSYFPVGRTGFLVVGGTINEPAAIQRNFATISSILETFRPSPKLTGSAVR
jgi:hypothetical protein